MQSRLLYLGVLCALSSATASAQQSLTTLFASDNGGSVGGTVYFDVFVHVPIQLVALELNCSAAVGTPVGVQVYQIPGTYSGNELNPSGWTFVSQDSGNSVSSGPDQPTSILLSNPISLPTGSWGLALIASNTGHRYTNGNGSNQTYSNPDLTLQLGSATNSLFGPAVFQPRVCNATLWYVGGSGGPSNDECSGALPAVLGVNPGTNLGASSSQPPWPCVTSHKDVWFHHFASATGPLQIDTCGGATNYDTTLEVFDGTCGALTSLACNDDTCGLGSSVQVNVTIGRNYLIRVGGYVAAEGTFDLNLSQFATPPVIRSVSPPVVLAGGAPVNLVVRGDSFTPGAVVLLDGVPRPTVYIGPTRLEFVVSAADLARSRRVGLYVYDTVSRLTSTESRRLFVAQPHSVEYSTVSTGGIAGDADSSEPAVSSDARFVAFASRAGNLVAGDSNGRWDVFVRDRCDETTSRVSISASGAEANGDCRRPSLSADGRFVVFESSATNLVLGPLPAFRQIYRHDRDVDDDGNYDEPGAVATILISTVGPFFLPANADCRATAQAIGDDGSAVCFDSTANNLGIPVVAGRSHCYLRRLGSGALLRISSHSGGGEANADSFRPAISGDGLWAAFETDASNLFADANPARDIVRKRVSSPGGLGQVELVSRASGATGPQADAACGGPAISRTGQFVSFHSAAANLAGADANGTDDVYRRDFGSDTTLLISFATHGGSGNGRSHDPAITPTGCTMFVSVASDLGSNDSNLISDVYAWDSQRPTYPHLPVSMYNYPYGSMGSSPSGDGGVAVAAGASLVAFSTSAAGLAMSLPTAVPYGVSFVMGSVAPFAPIAPMPAPDENPVTFSVDGPVHSKTEGLTSARGTGISGPFATRQPPVPRAEGIVTARPGDVADYRIALAPAEAEMFQSEPDPPMAAPPSGTNNQIVVAPAAGLVAGTPLTPYRDNIDALSFGEDFFGVRAATPISGLPSNTAWQHRTATFLLPEVTVDVGTSLRFAVDPFAIGVPATAVRTESLGFDNFLGPLWWSPGNAAGDVFATPTLVRPDPPAPGINTLVHGNALLALVPPPAIPNGREDDLDALECVGDNDPGSWSAGFTASQPGNLHGRVVEVAPGGLGAPRARIHELAIAPVFLSVDRQSTGARLSGVRTQFIAGEAAADVFMAFEGSNWLLIDETELGLYPGISSYSDDLDALVLKVHPGDRPALLSLARDALAASSIADPTPGNPASGDEYRLGPGFSYSLLRYALERGVRLRIRVGFSVTTDSIGLMGTAVDYEAGLQPTMQQSGDVFFTQFGSWLDAPAIVSPWEPAGFGMNWLWYDEVALGLDQGTWLLPAPVGTSLAVLPDELNALDTICSMPSYGGGQRAFGSPCPGTGGFGPILTPQGWPHPGRVIALSVHRALGSSTFALIWGTRWGRFPLGSTAVDWPLYVDPTSVFLTTTHALSGVGAGEGRQSIQLRIPDQVVGPFDVAVQAFVLDPSGVVLGALSSSNAVVVEIR